MKNRYHIIPRSAAAVPACGLILSLLTGFAVAQERSGKPSVTGNGLPEMPMTAPPEHSLAHEVAQKQAVESKLLSDMENLENWEPWLWLMSNYVN